MLKNENIICISSIDWNFIWQGHQEIMSTLAENQNRILFIENTGVRMPGVKDIPRIKDRVKNFFRGVSGIRQEKDNLHIFSPLVLPFPYLRIAKWINRQMILSVLRKWVKFMHFNDPVIWVFLPTPLSLEIIDNLDAKIVVYYCIDNFRVSSASAKKIRNSEIKLLKKVDLVFVTSRELYNYCSAFNANTHIFPFAVNFKEFEKARLKKDFVPDDLVHIKKPIIGYVGGLHKWVDLKLMARIARECPHFSLVFIGPVQTDVSGLSDFKNIHILGQRDHSVIPYYINSFDVCIIPYLITDYTNNVYPTKLNEYLALGKPVVSTELVEVIAFNKENDNLVLIGKDYDDFIDNIQASFSKTDPLYIDRCISAAGKNSWDVRIEEMSALIQDVSDKKFAVPADWRESLLKLYKKSRRRLLKISFIGLGLYLVIFYTPLIWSIAEPLKILQPPEKAGCIVVFAGGVGESGRPGEGYEERVQYAVRLYNETYAENIIFSSGYLYVFNETDLMKALAVSLGVPQKAIHLENKAGSTYENVLFTKEILDKYRWNKILLVSSPYHMRRVSLVFNKIAEKIKVVYTPIPDSLFYARPKKVLYGRKVQKQISSRQIKGILHEYIGILYYWWKGYI